MNWVGGTLSRLRGRDDKKIQREFFEKKRYEKTLDTIPVGMQSPTKKKELAISQDLLSLHTVLQTHSETNNRLYKQFKHPNVLDLKQKAGVKRTISFDLMQEPVLNEMFHTRTEGFQDLETPTCLLDVKKWRGEYKQGKTLGMSKAALCLRQFQEQEQIVFQREGVEECGKENIPIFEGKEMQEGLGEREEIVKKREKYMQWNRRVCEEPDELPGNSKWLEFLYGANKANSKRVSPVDHVIQHTSVQMHPNTNLAELSTVHMEVCDTEDLMEFEREKIIRRHPGQSEDPFYLTLTSNRDSFKGYKRPRIDSIDSSSLGSSVVNTVKDRMGGFLDESVFATPTDESILRPDGMLTENPLPYAYRSGMRSIKDFIANKTLKYEKLHDALTDEELEELDSSVEDSDSMQAPNSIPVLIPTKSKFVVPFAIKEESPIPLSLPKEEKQKSYDRFLQSLVAPNTTSISPKENAECETTVPANITQLSTDNKMDSLMMPILKWKEKEATEDTYSENINNSIESIPAGRDECCEQEDKESNTNKNAASDTTEHMCDEEPPIVITNINIEEKSASAHVEADLNVKETDFVENDENSADLVSGSNTENVLMGESVAVRLEDPNNIPEVQEMNLTECNELEVINGSLDVTTANHGSIRSDSVTEIGASPTQFEMSVGEEANESVIEAPTEIDTIYSVEIVNNETETNEIELKDDPQMEVDKMPEGVATCRPQEQDELVVIRDNIIPSTEHIEFTQESEQNIVCTSNSEIKHIETITACNREESSQLDPEYSTSDAGVQYSQQSNGDSAEERECRLVTERKECQTGLEVMERECQTTSLGTERECQTDIGYPNSIEESKNVKSQEIQTVEEIISRAEDKLTSQEIQTEDLTHNNNGNQTDILLLQFPIEMNREQNKYEQHDYENFILYQQQIIKALQRELEWSNL